MAQGAYAQAGGGDDGNNRVRHPGALQLLRGERELPCDTELLEVPEIHHLPHVEPPAPEALHEV